MTCVGFILTGNRYPNHELFLRHLRFCYSDRVNHGHASLCFDPDFGTAAQRLVRTVNNCAWSVNYGLVAVVICFVSLHCNDRFTFAALRIATNYVLVYVYIFFHLYLSVNALARVSRRLMASYRTLSGLI